MTVTNLIALIAAAGFGGLLQQLVAYFKDRRKDKSAADKTEAEADRIDVDKKLAYLTAVIEQLQRQSQQSYQDRDRFATELAAEQVRSSELRKRTRELEDELDVIHRRYRELQHKCEYLEEQLRMNPK